MGQRQTGSSFVAATWTPSACGFERKTCSCRCCLPNERFLSRLELTDRAHLIVCGRLKAEEPRDPGLHRVHVIASRSVEGVTVQVQWCMHTSTDVLPVDPGVILNRIRFL
jgi:hypothetical protein